MALTLFRERKQCRLNLPLQVLKGDGFCNVEPVNLAEVIWYLAEVIWDVIPIE